MHQKIKALSNAVTSRAGRQVLQAQKHSPTIFFAAGVAGVVTTVVLASRATLKLEGVIEEHEETTEKAHLTREEHPDSYSEKDMQHDLNVNLLRTGLKISKLYGPAFVVGAASIGALTGAHVTLSRRNAAIVAAYAGLEKGFREYRDRVLEDAGVDKDREYRYGTDSKEVRTENKKGEVKVKNQTVFDAKDGPSIYSKFFTPDNDNWNVSPEANVFFIKLQQNYLNDVLNARGHVFLNEVHDALSLPRTPEGQMVGWVKNNPKNPDHDGYIDFGIWDDDRMEAMHEFFSGHEDHLLLDFNVDGIVYDLI